MDPRSARRGGCESLTSAGNQGARETAPNSICTSKPSTLSAIGDGQRLRIDERVHAPLGTRARGRFHVAEHFANVMPVTCGRLYVSSVPSPSQGLRDGAALTGPCPQSRFGYSFAGVNDLVLV